MTPPSGLRRKASLNDMTYSEKLPHHLNGNALTRSLHDAAYQRNPGFQQTIAEHGLPFRAHSVFAKADLAHRSEPNCQRAALIWSPERLHGEEAR